jgi:hypothetical protein
MKYLFTLLVCVLGALLISVGVSQAFDHDSRGRNFVQWFLAEINRMEALKQRGELMNRLWDMKTTAVEEYIADRATLQEVMERFEEAEDLMADDSTGVVAPYHRPQTTEQKCRQIIGWVEDELRNDPEKARKVVERLKQELAEESASGTISQ